MNTINELSNLLIIILRAGLGFRIIYCCIRLMFSEEEQGTYKRRLKNSLIAVVVNELVWVIKDLVISYF
ncbi:MAG: mercury transporter [Oscillospiraceae bacterium]|nr:mercury transporter [Oscillospiraceae bacterium]